MLIAERYRLVHLVGSGGMGRVWLARDEMLHRDVAVKEIVLPVWLTQAERDELHRRTMREARTAGRLSHPNVVQIYDVIHIGGSPWIIMEYVPSRSLHEVLETDGPLPPRRVAEIGLAVLDALRAAHRAGVLHRDVKPHNVLIGETGRVVLTDFGLATFDGGDGATTRPGVVLGSPQYVAPERAADGLSSVESDLWSLGATLYAAVEGRAPYARETAMATLTALATARPDPVRRAGPLRPVLAGLLRRNPQQRLVPEEIERLLRRISDGTPGSGRQPAPQRPSDEGAGDRRGETGSGRTGPRRAGLDAAVARWRGRRGTPGRRRDGDPLGTRWWARAWRIRAWRFGAATAALVLVAALGAVLVLTSRRDQPGVNAERVTPAGPTGSKNAPFACAGPLGDQITTPVASIAPPPGERFALVTGWTWYIDPTGFRIAAPQGWRHYLDGTAVCFREPRGSRVLSVDPAAPHTDGAEEAAAHWRARESELRATGGLSNYDLVGITALGIFQGAAAWECRWTSANGKSLHTYRLLVNAGSRAYVISWLTREFDWQVNQAFLPMIRQSFTPAS